MTFDFEISRFDCNYHSGPSCSKLTLLVYISLKIQTLIFESRQNFLLKKSNKLLLASFFSVFGYNISVFGYKVIKHLMR